MISSKNPIRSACEKAVQDNDDIEAAVKAALLAIGKPSEEVVEWLVTMAVRETVYDIRHHMRFCIKMPRNTTRTSAAVAAAIGDGIMGDFLKRWRVGNRTLADLTGEELVEEAGKERSASDGHLANARFYEALHKKVGQKKVGDVVDSDAARRMWIKVRGQGRIDSHSPCAPNRRRRPARDTQTAIACAH